MSRAIVPIVEGHGEVKAVPALLGRLLERMNVQGIHVAEPVRKHRGELTKPEKLAAAIEVAKRIRNNVGAILVLLDADKDCPVELVGAMLHRAQSTTHLPVRVVIAKREFEAWFLGCKESFRGFMGIPEDAVAPDNPEQVSAKGMLQSNMLGHKYNPSIDQVEFVRKMNLEVCHDRCSSFKKLVRDVQALVEAMRES